MLQFLQGGISGGQGGINSESSAESGGDDSYEAVFGTGAKNIGAGAGVDASLYQVRKLVTNPLVIGGVLLGVYLVSRKK